jgi:predicted PurR-regulated permease PerM
MSDTVLINRLLLLTLLVGLLALGYQVLSFFVVPVIWAAILAYVTWPVYRYISDALGVRRNLSALLTVLLLVLVIGVPLLIGTFFLQQEARTLYVHVQGQMLSGKFSLPDVLRHLPVVGAQLDHLAKQMNADPSQIMNHVRAWLQAHLAYGREIFSEVTRNLARVSIAIFTLFFMYRDGTTILAQVQRALHQILGQRSVGYVDAIGRTTQAVVYGIGLTALAQSLLAGIGYVIAGAPNPILLTLMTLLIALVPFGTPFAWGAVVFWLFANGQTVEAIGLGIWGIIVVSWIDNIIRPMVISGATKVPFLLIMFGVLGGLGAFGMVGLFIGPVILAVLLAVWREWLAHAAEVEAAELSRQHHNTPKPDAHA